MSAGKILTGNLFNAVSVHVKQHAAIDDAAAELKQAVEGESSDVGLAPPLPSVLHIFLKLQPSARWRQWMWSVITFIFHLKNKFY